jgi:hypothetical protein
VLPAGPTAATTGVGDVDGGPPEGAAGRFGRATTGVTTGVGDVDGGPRGGCYWQVWQRPPPELETSMVGPLGSMAEFCIKSCW